MKMKQVKLKDGTTRVMAWIESNLAKKNLLLEEDNGRRWRVGEVYNLTVESSQLHQDWKVGGLV